MKQNITYLAVMLVMFMTACTPEKDYTFEVDTTDIHVGPEGGVETINLNVGEEWTARATKPWIAFSPANGRGSEECRVIIDSTLISDVRRDTIEILTVSGNVKSIIVSQDGFDHQIKVSKSLVEIKDFDVLDKRKFEIVVNTNVDFRVVIPESHAWLSCTKLDSVNVMLDRGARPRNVRIRFDWDVNMTSDVRDVEVKFVAKDVSGDVNADVLKVSQGSAPDIETVKDTPAGDSLALLSISRFLGCWAEYDTGLEMKRWEGVTLHKTGKNKGRVKSAQFVFFETDEPLPYAVKYLTAAEELYFFSNVNSHQKNLNLGEDICSLTELKRLTVFAYGLTELPENMGNMKSLRYLDLAGNNFASIPKVLRKCENLKALYLTSNQRRVISDLSNTVEKEIGGLIDECVSDGTDNISTDNCSMKFPQWILEWNQLDTLRLSVNFLQGILPSDEELLAAGFKAWDVNEFDESVTEVNIKDSLGTEGIKYFTNNKIPMVLPDTDFLAINLNRLHGKIPNWLKYHPKLDYWSPLMLVFPQEGKDKDAHPAGFTDVPTNLNYYYEMYANKKWSETNIVK